MKNRIFIPFFLFSCLFINVTKGQGWDTIDTLIESSPYVFEATVVSRWTMPLGDFNYEYNLVRISKVIQGNVHCGYAEIVTWSDSIYHYSDPVLILHPGEIGIFMCCKSEWPSLPGPKDNPEAFSVWGGIEGVFLYGYYGDINHDVTDSAMPYWTGTEKKFFIKPAGALNYFAQRFGHPYISCELDTGITADFSWYPNPVTDEITMRVPGDAPASLTLYDMTGRMVWQEPPPGLNGQRAIEISGYRHLLLQREDLSSLKPGAYIGKAVAGGHVYTLKLIKM